MNAYIFIFKIIYIYIYIEREREGESLNRVDIAETALDDCLFVASEASYLESRT